MLSEIAPSLPPAAITRHPVLRNIDQRNRSYSPPLCTYTRSGYIQRERPLSHYHPIGWLGRGSDYRLHPGALALCTLAKSNRMLAGTAGVCEEIVARGESIRDDAMRAGDSTICTNVCGNHYRRASVNVIPMSNRHLDLESAIIRFRLLIKYTRA